MVACGKKGSNPSLSTPTMPQKIIQTQTAVQTQQLSLMQVALAQMVELPLAQFAERIQTEMIDNEALEEYDAGGNDPGGEVESDMATGDDTDTPQNEDDGDGTANLPDDIGMAMGDYLNEDDVPDYLRERAESEGSAREYVMAAQNTFYEDLLRQIGEHNLSDHERDIMDYLIGSLDSDGFLRKDTSTLVDELAIYHNIYTYEVETERLIAILQTFEPRGIGARSLQECLRIQLSDPDNRSPWRKDALAVVDRCFKEFSGNRWDEVVRRLQFSPAQAEHVRHELLHLDPAPGRAFSESGNQAAPTVIPDFFVDTAGDGTAVVRLNTGDVPRLRVSQAFRESIRQYAGHEGKLNREQREAYVYAQGKVKAAQGFIALVNRRRTTLLAVMQSIVDLQRPFFENDDDESLLHPMTLRDVAAHNGLDISTVSRTVSAKYVQTAFGVYPLKHFFSGQFTSAEGDELSVRQVKTALAQLVRDEDKQAPLSDEALAAALKRQGLTVARRTVAKYREALHIPVARFRKKI